MNPAGVTAPEFAAPVSHKRAIDVCFGKKPKAQYDAYSAGDFNQWKTSFDKKAEIESALARGEIDQASADQQLASFGNLDSLASRIKGDASANMELRETERQHDVGLGRIGIDKAFGNFNDDYYGGYKDDYTSFYYPQLDRQYSEAVDKMTAALAGRGMLESTAGAGQIADLTRQNTEARTNIGNEAVDAAQKLRGTVENAKSSLYGLNEASADPQAVNAQAVGQATALVAPPTYNPLGQVFASALNSLGNFQQAANNRPSKGYSSPFATGYGSGRVVN